MEPSASHEPTIGVLAMQGAVAAHVAMLELIGVTAAEVRTRDELAAVDAVILPGGESTAIRKQLVRSQLYDDLRQRIADGLPTLGTCAGMIVLSHAPDDGAPPCFGLLDIDVERNGFGRQVHSGHYPIRLSAATADREAIFIRAPRIQRVGPEVAVIARLVSDGDESGEEVAVQQRAILGATFHPELGDDPWLHEVLARLARQARGVVLSADRA